VQEELPPEMAQELLRQVFDLWINPEVVRRQAEGGLTAPVDLISAQVIFHSERPLEVRLNHEVKAIAEVRLNQSVAQDEPITVGNVVQVLGIDLTEDDADSAHITLIRNGSDEWTLSFNAGYNRGKAKVLLAIATEYVEVAEHALQKGFHRSFVDNLYSAVELAAKGRLILIPNPRMLTAKSHGYIVTNFNIFGGKLGNVDRSHVKLVNELSALRSRAKYGIDRFIIEPQSAEAMLRGGREMIEAIQGAL